MNKLSKSNILIKIGLMLAVFAVAVLGLMFFINPQPTKEVKADEYASDASDIFRFYDNGDGTYKISGGSNIADIIDGGELSIPHYVYLNVDDEIIEEEDEDFGTTYVISGVKSFDSQYLIYLYIEDGITSIDAGAFEGNHNLQYVDIASSVTSIGQGAFADCPITEITIPFVGLTGSGTTNRQFCKIFGAYNNAIPSSLTTVTVLGGNIYNSAFNSCSSLTTVTLGSNVSSIGSSAFYGCSSLTTITLPNTLAVSSIGNNAFDLCKSINNVTYSTSGTGYSFNNGVLTLANQNIVDNPAWKKINPLVQSVVFDGNGSNITSIGNYAFNYCYQITSITLPSNVSSIGSYAFYYCRQITSITLGNNVSSIGRDAFNGCSSLTTVTLGSNVSSIGINAFYNCSSLTTITIPNTLTSIGNSAFDGCRAISNVTYSTSGTGYSFNNGVLTVANQNIVDNPAWKNINPLVQSVVFDGNGSNITSIGRYAFRTCYRITSITLPSSLQTINGYAFSFCENITSITIPNTVKKIEACAFQDCTHLENLTLSSSLEEIGANAFHLCALTTVSIPNSVWNIDYNAFDFDEISLLDAGNGYYYLGNETNPYLCLCKTDDNITDCLINENCKIISTYAFYNNPYITSITLPNSILSISGGAIYNCSNLETLHLNYGLRYIGDESCMYTSKLKTITIPNTVTYIGSMVFGTDEGDFEDYALESIIIDPTSLDDDCTYYLPPENWYFGNLVVEDGELTNEFLDSVPSYYIELRRETYTPLVVTLKDSDLTTTLAEYHGITTPNIIPSKAGFKFIGWRYGEGNTSAIPTYGSELVDANSDGNLTLYAVWGYDDLSTGVELPSKTSVVMVSAGLSVVAILSVAGIVFCIKRIGYYKKKR